MPIYPYVCDKCEHHENQFRSVIGRDTVEGCPKCGGNLKRKLVAIRFVISSGGTGAMKNPRKSST